MRQGQVEASLHCHMGRTLSGFATCRYCDWQWMRALLIIDSTIHDPSIELSEPKRKFKFSYLFTSHFLISSQHRRV
jgi:hypothetical protein